ENYPQSLVTVICGARPAKIFENNPHISKLVIFDKRSSIKHKIRLLLELRREKFDIVVDFRNSFFGFFLSGARKHFASRGFSGPKRHRKDLHLSKLIPLKLGLSGQSTGSVYTSLDDEKYIDSLLERNNIHAQDILIVVAAGARSHIKRWPKEKFSELIHSLGREFNPKIVLIGDKDDSVAADYIAIEAGYPVLNLCDKTTLAQLAYLLKKSKLVITNDSASMHLASYVNAPVLAIFGPTSEIKYGPWPQISAVVKKNIICRPCEDAQCRFGTLRCMHVVQVEDVLREARKILRGTRDEGRGTRDEFKRILVVRTDRIGDVLLSTPVLKGLRENFPHAYIAMMVSPYAKDVIEMSPFVDEVITYDKDVKHKSWLRSMKFSQKLKKRGFDLALILHPVNRAHLITYFSGIKKRVGFDRKFGFLLTDRIKHAKQEGQKHELEYNLDFLRYLGIEPRDKKLFMPIKPESEEVVKQLLEKEGVAESDELLAVHAGASCISKIWPAERFAGVAEKLAKSRGMKVVIVAGPKDVNVSNDMVKRMSVPVVNLAGKTSVSQLASVLKRCRLFISNDSGPVHIASAVGTPVISIFGRNQKGLSPKRWGPVGDRDKVLHKKTDCIECLAHNCTRGFLCLNSITVDEVVEAAEKILNNSSK
ncbi:MAG: lipopolysaccharide heptosyltransferase II, partial [Candidatus Omnitrophota bacterium]